VPVSQWKMVFVVKVGVNISDVRRVSRFFIVKIRCVL
jgi:hypothetical protein